MRKLILTMVAFLAAITCANAQNYAGSSRFDDNWSLTVQGGLVTPLTEFLEEGTTTPILGIGLDKYITPWLGFGGDLRTSIGVGDKYNNKTAFDMLNLSGYAKLNLSNIAYFNGIRKTFEPVFYAGVGIGHNNPSSYTNYRIGNGHVLPYRDFMTFRTGLELNINLGQDKDWAFVANPSFVWGDICNGRLFNTHGNFELTVGFVHHFKTSNGTNGFLRARLYDQEEVDRLNWIINEQRHALEMKPRVVERTVEKVVYVNQESTFKVDFEKDSAILTEEAKRILDKVPENAVVEVAGSTSPEGSTWYNEKLAESRALAVKQYLDGRGVKVEKAVGGAAGRMAVVTIKQR